MPADPDRTQAFTPAELAVTGAFDVAPLRLAGDDAPLAGRRLGDFLLHDRLGAGGMGTVYRATQVSRGRPAAVKVVLPHLARQPGFAARFHREVKLMGRLRHPNLVRAYAAGEADGVHYLGMELCPGGSLGDRLTAGRLPVAEVVRLARGLALALRHAHGQGLVHRDVKPDNVLFAADGTPKLGDLGLAKAADDSLDAGAGAGLTRTGVGIGTPLYAPPEQAADAKRADARSDLYALGGVLYHALTGRPPFAGRNILELLQAKARGDYPPARTLNPQVPPDLDRLLTRLLARLPADRPASAAELAAALGVAPA